MKKDPIATIAVHPHAYAPLRSTRNLSAVMSKETECAGELLEGDSSKFMRMDGAFTVYSHQKSHISNRHVKQNLNFATSLHPPSPPRTHVLTLPSLDHSLSFNVLNINSNLKVTSKFFLFFEFIAQSNIFQNKLVFKTSHSHTSKMIICN